MHTAPVSMENEAFWKYCTINSLGRTSNFTSREGIDISPILWMKNRVPVTHGMNIITDENLLLWKPRLLISYTIVFVIFIGRNSPWLPLIFIPRFMENSNFWAKGQFHWGQENGRRQEKGLNLLHVYPESLC